MDFPGSLRLIGTVGHGSGRFAPERLAPERLAPERLAPERLGGRAKLRLPHRLLRVSPHETDPVMIILAAQIQLRRLRRTEPGHSPDRIRRKIRDISAARDALLMAEARLQAGKSPRTV